MNNGYQFRQVLPYHDFAQLRPVIKWCQSEIGDHNHGWCVTITNVQIEWWFEKREHWTEFTLRWR